MTVKGWQSLIALVASSYHFVQVRGTWAWAPTGLIPWFSKTEGNTYATLLHHPLLFGEVQRNAQEVARRISGAIAGESAQKSTYQVPITYPYLPHYIICHFPLIFLSPQFTLAVLFALSLYPPSLFASFCPLAFCLLVCYFACLSRWLKIILNCRTSSIPTTMILLALRLLLLPMLNLVKLILLCWMLSWKIRFPAFLVKMSLPI